MRTRLLTGLVAASVSVTGCALSFLGRDFTPIGPDPASSAPDVAATYEWIANIQGNNSYTLTGTITFEQSENRVSVTNTTHSNPANRLQRYERGFRPCVRLSAPRRRSIALRR